MPQPQQTRSRRSQTIVIAMVAVVVCVLVVQYSAALGIGVSHTAAIRTYAFWAAVCVPVAVLADMLLRSIAEYRLTQMAIARVKSRR